MRRLGPKLSPQTLSSLALRPRRQVPTFARPQDKDARVQFWCTTCGNARVDSVDAMCRDCRKVEPYAEPYWVAGILGDE